MDVVYPLVSSGWQDKELMYSLRSLARIKHNRVFVIGYKPNWLTNTIHIPFGDTGRPEQSTMLKICHICKETDISEDFVLMNDDFYLLREMIEIPYWYDGYLSQSFTKRYLSSAYYMATENTIGVVGDKKFFEVHGPIVLNKFMFPEIMNHFDWTKKDYLKRSLYCNVLQYEGVEMKDTKDINPVTITDEPFFSSGNRIMFHTLGKYLEGLYPEKSVYEI